jgi:hypothetical protein
MFAVKDEEGSAGFLPSRQANEQAPRGFTRWHYLWRARPPLFLSAVFVAEWRAGLLTISWPPHSDRENSRFKMTLLI